jgi:hypothetical protein
MDEQDLSMYLFYALCTDINGRKYVYGNVRVHLDMCYFSVFNLYTGSVCLSS